MTVQRNTDGDTYQGSQEQRRPPTITAHRASWSRFEVGCVCFFSGVATAVLVLVLARHWM